jgi:hypothetical protein
MKDNRTTIVEVKERLSPITRMMFVHNRTKPGHFQPRLCCVCEIMSFGVRDAQISYHAKRIKRVYDVGGFEQHYIARNW